VELFLQVSVLAGQNKRLTTFGISMNQKENLGLYFMTENLWQVEGAFTDPLGLDLPGMMLY
jgi:hypothetical protein